MSAPTQAAQVYDDLITLIESVYPVSDGWKELVNPYDPGMSDDLTANQAWGLTQNSGTNTNRLVNCSVTWRRDFELILVRKYHSGMIRTVNAMNDRRALEMQLFLDQELLMKKLEHDPLVDGSHAIAQARMESDNGIEFMRDGDEQFFMLKSLIFVEYFVSLET